MYRTKRIEDSNYIEIQKLHGLCFDSPHSMLYINNKYNTSVFGLKNIGILAFAEVSNEPAAYYGVFPIVLNYQGQNVLIAQSGDTMTAPIHQKKGLFTRLANETYQLAEKEGVELVYGFPNSNSFYGFKNKLNWKFSGFMYQFTFPINGGLIGKYSYRFDGLKRIAKQVALKRINRYKIDANQNDLEGFNYSKVKGNIKKDIGFFEYKLRNESNYLIKYHDYKLLVKVDVNLYIGEVCYFKTITVEGLLYHLNKLAKELMCSAIVFTLNKNHWLFDMLEKIKEPSQTLPIGFYIINEKININEIQFSLADYDTF